MTSNPIHAVILAGGSGTRFWPLSRETWPKQMLQIVGEDSLIRQTIKRISGFVPPENIWIVTTRDKAADIRFHIEPLGVVAKGVHLIEEPMGRNTAPAIGLAAIYLHRVDPESLMIIMPSDHAVPDTDKFLDDVRLALDGARAGHLVTFGIKPHHPETGYGYIKAVETSRPGTKGLQQVERFVEKPDLQTARAYLSDGSYFWNSGIFVWQTSKILSEIDQHIPSLSKVLKEIDSLVARPNDPMTQRLNDPMTNDPMTKTKGWAGEK